MKWPEAELLFDRFGGEVGEPYRLQVLKDYRDTRDCKGVRKILEEGVELKERRFHPVQACCMSKGLAVGMS